MRLLAVLGGMMMMLACTVGTVFAADTVSGSLTEVLHNKGVIDDASYNDIKNAEALGGKSAMDKKLLDVLKSKGVIDDATYSSLSAQASSAPVASTTASSERPLDSTFAKVEEGFARLGGDTVKLKIGTWTQLGYVYDNSGSNEGALPGSAASPIVTDVSSNFYTRFARIYLNGTLSEKIGFRVMFDAAGGAPNVRDAYIWFDHIPMTRVTVGQFLIPFGSETWRAPFDLPQVNYSLPTQMMSFGFRDVGLMAATKYSTKVGSMPLMVQMQNCLLNGNGMNVADNNNQKDYLGRFTATPLVPGLTIGGSVYLGRLGSDSRLANRRWGAEVEYKPENFMKGLLLRGEYLQQKRYIATSTALAKVGGMYDESAARIAGPAVPVDNRNIHSDGWYVLASYRLNGINGAMSVLNDLEPNVRYDALDEDLNTGNNKRDRFTLGMNYWFNKYIRLMADYEWIHADGGLKGRALFGNSQYGHQVLTTNLQIWF